MQTTRDFVNAIKARNGNASDYRAAKLLCVTPATICRYQKDQDFFSDKVAIKAADLLGLPAEYVMSCAHAQRAKDEGEKQAWARLCRAVMPEDCILC